MLSQAASARVIIRPAVAMTMAMNACPHSPPSGNGRYTVSIRLVASNDHGVRAAVVCSQRWQRRLPRQRARVHASGAAWVTAAAAAPAPEAPVLKPPKLKALAATVSVGLAVLLLPRPEALTPEAWRLLALFLSTITGIVLQPLPMGAVALMALGVAVATKVLTWSAAFAAFSAEVPWLIVSAMFIAQGFKKTGLGQRLAFTMVTALGRWGAIGLAYGLVAAEALLSPMIPSVAARAGGIILPITTSLAEAGGSRAGDGTERRLGAYLVATVYQCSVVSSAMFLTANHPNPLSAQLAAATVGVTLSWGSWALAAVVPGLVSLALIPLLIYKMYPPEAEAADTGEVLAAAEERLQQLGAIKPAEATMAAVLLGTLVLWVFGHQLGVAPGLAALAGLSALLLTGVISWDECLGCKSAWNTLIWFAALIAMSGALKASGLVAYFSDGVAAGVASFGLPWGPSFLMLLLVYILSHVFFASNIAHVNMMGGFTPYGMSHAPMFFGSSYVSTRSWWGVGLAVLALNMVVWLVVGGLWWRVIGLW
eukprot:jgi/Tetstr1/424543/TSEL_015070.t1